MSKQNQEILALESDSYEGVISKLQVELDGDYKDYVVGVMTHTIGHVEDGDCTMHYLTVVVNRSGARIVAGTPK